MTYMQWRVVVSTIVALGLGGLPLTGGALAKLAVKDFFDGSLIGVLADLSAVGTTLLMVHFLVRLSRSTAAEPTTGAALAVVLPWRLAALAATAMPVLLRLANGRIRRRVVDRARGCRNGAA